MPRHHETGHQDVCILACALVMMFGGMTQAPAAQAAGREDQASACKKDVFRLCFMDIPNEQLMEECLESKLDRLSPRCRAMFEEPDTAPSPASVRAGQVTVPARPSPPVMP